ncbi:hypothetical protein BLNAU_5921 [Blattamonas nauphoetae]|uniref:Uncharacterized protein n=1 Tax=Blattamonas nauphoetae TaxID=2049346 RepID=A0ABQ9Y5V0_9EUKA|nr:hypothetical protein BLNAU_5921 [Blattamonas nauphoetae]
MSNLAPQPTRRLDTRGRFEYVLVVVARNSSFTKYSSNLDESDTHPVYTLTYRTGTNQKSDKETILKNQELDQQNPIDVAKIDEQEAMIIAMNAGHTDHIMHHNVPTTIGSHAVTQKDYFDTMDRLNNSGLAQSRKKQNSSHKMRFHVT